MMPHKMVTLPATLQAVSQFTQELETWFAPLLVSTRVGVVLAIQELCVNIVQHAYHGHPGEIQIEVEWTPHQIRFQLIDHAPHQFTMPEVINAPDPSVPQENGMGLFLIHQVFDQVIYEPSQAQSCWRLLKRLERLDWLDSQDWPGGQERQT